MIFVVVVVVGEEEATKKNTQMDGQKLLTKARGCADPLHRRLTPARDGLPKTLWRQLLTEKNYSRHKLYFTNQSSKIQVPLLCSSRINRLEHDDPKVRSAVQGE